MSKQFKIGLIAGGGALPHEVIIGAQQQGYDIFVAALKGFAHTSDFTDPVQEFGFGEIGRLFKVLKSQNCTHIVLAGNVSRPNFKALKPDFGGIKLLPKVVAAAAKGDDALLRVVVEIFEKQGFTILAPQDLCGSVLMKEGVLGHVKPQSQHQGDIQKAREIAAVIGSHDIGQGCVVCNGLVLAVEAQEGTDKMLMRVAELPDSIRGCQDNKQGVLAKRLKPGQEDRIDLPTIGTQTVKLAANAGLAGIVIEAEKAFVMDINAVRELADRLGLFILGHKDA